jgi:hypothetical protein
MVCDTEQPDLTSKEDEMRRISCSLLVVALAACDDTRPTQVPLPPDVIAVLNANQDQNAILFPKTARPYGASLSEWADRESQWVYGLPASNNPLTDQTGASCGIGQEGPVWFIPRIAGPRVFSGSRTCTIPFGKAIFLEIGAYVNEWPCPDPSFQPAPGQSMYDFLRSDAKAFMDGVNRLEVSLDGRALDDVLSYRFASDAIFTLTGDPTFATLDACVTGTPQPAIVDGFFMMFKPLDRGEHVLRVFGTDIRGANKTYTYYLNIV